MRMLIVLCLFLGSCSTMQTIAEIPAIECDEATYSSPFTTIEVTQAKKTGSYIRFESLKVINQYFPGFKWNVSIKGYKRKL